MAHDTTKRNVEHYPDLNESDDVACNRIQDRTRVSREITKENPVRFEDTPEFPYLHGRARAYFMLLARHMHTTLKYVVTNPEAMPHWLTKSRDGRNPFVVPEEGVIDLVASTSYLRHPHFGLGNVTPAHIFYVVRHYGD